MLIAIWAHAKDGLIGKEMTMPWHLPKDLAFFKQQSLGKPVVMGRKTYQGFGYRPLPKRENIILTRQKTAFDSDYDQSHVTLTDSIQAIIERGQKEDVIIMGGSQVYQLFWPYLDELRITEIDGQFSGDTYFNPDLSDFEKYQEIEGETDAKNPYPFRFQFYRRKGGI